MSETPQWVEWPEWTPEKESRQRWLLNHIETCQSCDLYPEDGDAILCPALEAHLDGPHAVRGALSGAGR